MGFFTSHVGPTLSLSLCFYPDKASSSGNLHVKFENSAHMEINILLWSRRGLYSVHTHMLSME